MSALGPRSGIQVSSVYPTYTHIKSLCPLCVCVCVCVFVAKPVAVELRCHAAALILAHLSRRLIGELIVYPWIWRTSSVRLRPQCSNIFFSETAWPIKAKFYVEPPWVGGTKFCSRHLGHMTKMAATPIYGKNPSKIFFSRTGRRISTKLGM